VGLVDDPAATRVNDGGGDAVRVAEEDTPRDLAGILKGEGEEVAGKLTNIVF
jgi:hypothetical protein